MLRPRLSQRKTEKSGRSVACQGNEVRRAQIFVKGSPTVNSNTQEENQEHNFMFSPSTETKSRNG